MIIYGTGTKDLGTKKLPGANCPKCDSQSLHITGIAKYFDVFWIPVFPYKKKTIIHCANCDSEFKKNELNQSIKNKVDLEKKSLSLPFYLFSGLFLIVILIAYIIYSNKEHKAEVDENMKSLKTEDVLVFKNEDRTYSFGKVIELKKDTVFFNFSNYVYEGSKPSEYQMNKEKRKVNDFYNEDVYYYLIPTLDSLYNKGEIIDLFRKNND